MLTGAATTQQCFNTTSTYGGLLPADFDGRTLPAAGAPQSTRRARRDQHDAGALEIP